jgi:hypothetical protein
MFKGDPPFAEDRLMIHTCPPGLQLGRGWVLGAEGLSQLYRSAVSGGWTLTLVYYFMLGQGMVSPCQGYWSRSGLSLILRAAMPTFANSSAGFGGSLIPRETVRVSEDAELGKETWIAVLA